MSMTTCPDIAELPHTVGVVQAGTYFGLNRDGAYRLARLGRFPVPVLRVGRRLVVTRASLLAVLDQQPTAQVAP